MMKTMASVVVDERDRIASETQAYATRLGQAFEEVSRRPPAVTDLTTFNALILLSSLFIVERMTGPKAAAQTFAEALRKNVQEHQRAGVLSPAVIRDWSKGPGQAEALQAVARIGADLEAFLNARYTPRDREPIVVALLNILAHFIIQYHGPDSLRRAQQMGDELTSVVEQMLRRAVH